MAGAAIENRIYGRLANSTEITGITSNIYWGYLPETFSYPAVVISRISGVREHCMGSDPDLTHSRFQVTAWADEPEDVTTLATAIKATLDRWSSSTDFPYVLESLRDNEVPAYEETDAGAYRTCGVHIDYIVHHRESTA